MIPPCPSSGSGARSSCGRARSRPRDAAASSGSPGRRAPASPRSRSGSPPSCAAPHGSSRWTAFTSPTPSSSGSGRRDRKGAIDTFDAGGYVALLRRLRADPPELVYAPEFRREIEEPIGSAIAVPPDVPLVVTEGNYLLVGDGGWADVRGLLDEAWYLSTDEELRVTRLIQRHVDFGKSPAAAREWVLTSDERNAELVAGTRDRADVVIDLEGDA